MVRFGGKIDTFHAAVPMQMTDEQRAIVKSHLLELDDRLDSPIDQLLIRQWRRLGITPSAPADDATFIRRASIDICGTLPTREEVEAFIAETASDKRAHSREVRYVDSVYLDVRPECLDTP